MIHKLHCRKRKYTKATAQQALDENKDAPSIKHLPKRMYHCKQCGSWHLTCK